MSTPQFDWRKQLRDQFLHILAGAGIPWLLSAMLPWVVPVACMAVYVGIREYGQYPSKRWWDPPLDAVFWIIGLALGPYLVLRVWPGKDQWLWPLLSLHF